LAARILGFEPVLGLAEGAGDGSENEMRLSQSPLDLSTPPRGNDGVASRIFMASPSPYFPIGKPPADSLVCVIDDDPSVRRSLSRLFRSARLPAETFRTAEAYLDRAPHDGPSCLVLDLRLPDSGGRELQGAVTGRNTQIVFISGHGDVPACAEAMKAGAVDFLTKPLDEEQLLGAVARALTLSVQARKTAGARARARTVLDRLTPREFEVMRLVIAGLLNKQVAAVLGTSEKTVKIHRGRVMEKMEVNSVPELFRVAQDAGVEPAWQDEE
jgi:FixJ family two-component response regulator